MTRLVETDYAVGPVTLTVASNLAGGRWHGPFVSIAVGDGIRLTASLLDELATVCRKAATEMYRQAEENTTKNSQIVLAQGRKAQ